ncbi:MAG: hypothetical protein PWR21_1839 [Methanoculleus sp.]|nr:hypothetical protein [Methanoculleus sp.]
MSSIPAPTLLRVLPSMRRIALPVSWGEAGPYERRRLLASFYLDDVAADETESLHGVDAQSGDSPAGVFVSRFLDGYLNGFGIGHVNNLLL